MSANNRIDELLRSLRSSLTALEAAQKDGLAEIASDIIRWAGVQHLSQIAIQACVDIADEVLGYMGIEEPSRSSDVFPVLAGAGVLPRDVAESLAELFDFWFMPDRAYSQVHLNVMEVRVPVLLVSSRAFAEAVARWLMLA